MYGHSEEQPEYIGDCELCDAPMYCIDGKIIRHDCPYDRMDAIVSKIQAGFRAEKDYVLPRLTPHKLEAMLKDIVYGPQI